MPTAPLPADDPAPDTKYIVAIAVGHDAVSGGAISARGVTEHTFNAALARRIEAVLREHGISAVIINPDSKPIPLLDRPARARAAGADLLISVHHDSVQPQYLEEWSYGGHRHRYSDRFHGYSLFTSGKNRAYEQSLTIARHIGEALKRRGLAYSPHHAEPIKGENRPLVDHDVGIYCFDDLVVLKHATTPAVLIEAGIIVNRDEELTVSSDAYRTIVADAVVDAVERIHPR